MSLSSPLPLTTLFEPPNSCFSDVYLYAFTPGQSPQPAGPGLTPPVLTATTILYLGLPGSSDCLPTSWASSSFYSPGICPEGYTIACSSVNSVESVTETIATCCPNNFVCIASSQNAWQSTELCTSTFASNKIFNCIISEGGQIFLSSIQVYSGWGVNAYTVQVRWQSTDTAILKLLTPTLSFSTSSSSTLSLASSLSSHTTASSTSSITTYPTPPAPLGLSNGAKIAIGVTIPVAFLAILLGLFIFWRKRRYQTSIAPITTVTNPSTNPPWEKPELDAEGNANKFDQTSPRSQFQPAAELDATILKGL